MLQGKTPTNQIVVPVKRVKEIQRLNKSGKKPEKLLLHDESLELKDNDSFKNVVGQDDLHRFDRPKKQNQRKRRNFNRNPRRKPNTR